jgi:hypothetical protein
MSMKLFLLITLCFGFISSGCAARLGRLSDAQKSERLATEKGRLSDIKDPVERTKSYITISRFLLDFIAGAARDHDVEALGSLADQYTSAIRSARDTIVGSDRDATRKPAGYKDLELTLRQQSRRLEDISRSLSFDERAPITRARETADSIREELLRLLFPQSQKSRSLERAREATYRTGT